MHDVARPVMHLTLINPPTISCVTTMVQEAVPPLGLAYLCAAVEQVGFETTVVDAVGEALAQHTIYSRADRLLLRGLTTPEIIARIPPETDAIGVSCMFSDAWCPTRELIEAIRAAFPDKPIILGGEHATALPRYILETCPAVNYIVLGEGENTIVWLLDHLSRGEDPTGLPGVVGRDSEPAMGRQRPPRIADIGSIERPLWDRFPLEAYISGGYNHGLQRGRSMPILASRGCPYQCTFCSSPQMWTTRWRARDVDEVVTEMKDYIRRYAVNDFTFYDLTTIVRRDWIVAFCNRLIEDDLNVTWQLPSGTRSEVVDDEVAELLYRAGCRNLNFAPESGSPSVLRRIKKRVKVDRMLRSVEAASAAGIEVKVNIILGFPFETPRQLMETCSFLVNVARLGAEAVSVFPFCAYPGSELFEELRRDGTIELTDDYFNNLVFTDYGRIVSYSRQFSAGQLSAAVLLTNAVFYGTQLAVDPARLVAVGHQLLTRKQSGKVSNALEPMRRRRRAFRDLLRRSEGRRHSRAPAPAHAK